MTDPYNSLPPDFQKQNVPAASGSTDPQRPSAPPPPKRPDRIERLDVSDKWKQCFRLIAKAGGPELPDLKSLSYSDRRAVQLNWLAFFFWPIYLPIKGLWRQAVAYFAIAFTCAIILELIGLGKFSRAAGYGISAAAMIRTNIAYYRKMVLDESTWV